MSTDRLIYFSFAVAGCDGSCGRTIIKAGTELVQGRVRAPPQMKEVPVQARQKTIVERADGAPVLFLKSEGNGKSAENHRRSIVIIRTFRARADSVLGDVSETRKLTGRTLENSGEPHRSGVQGGC